jgi:hypothetical protein
MWKRRAINSRPPELSRIFGDGLIDQAATVAGLEGIPCHLRRGWGGQLAHKSRLSSLDTLDPRRNTGRCCVQSLGVRLRGRRAPRYS